MTRPAGSLVEVDCAGVDRLPEYIRSEVKGPWELHPQSDERMGARLVVPG